MAAELSRETHLLSWSIRDLAGRLWIAASGIYHHVGGKYLLCRAVVERMIERIKLPEGLRDGDRLPEPIFTPAYKAPQGEHDENINFERVAELIGADDAEALRALSLRIYRVGAEVALEHGLVLADTKFEFGRDRETGAITLADEVLTSDSSRYWDAAAYADADAPLSARLASFDKQIVRNWLRENWDGQSVPPVLPAEIVERTRARYAELLQRLGVPDAAPHTTSNHAK